MGEATLVRDRTRGGGPKFSFQKWGAASTLAAAWLVLIVVSILHRSDFLSHQTLLAVTFTMSVVGVLAVAQALIGISGGILDLSQPAGLVLSALVASKVLGAELGTGVAVLAAVASGAAWGFGNALLIVYGKLNPIIVTLATNFVGAAVLFLIFQSAQAPISSVLHSFGQSYAFGLPKIFWPMVGLVLVVGFFLPRTRYGLHVIAVGGNRFAAQTRGIALRRIRFGIFTVAGAIVGIAGVLFAASSGPFSPDAGAVYLLPVIASVILAGVSLSGGRGNIWLILLSVGFLSTVPTSLAFFGLSSDWQTVFQGLILVLAVALDGFRGFQRAL